MAEQAIINTSTLTSIGDAIRTKTGKTDTFLPSSMPTEILAIETGSDVSGVTAVASDVRSGKKFVNSSGTVVTGTVTARTSSSVTTSNNTVSIPAGIYDSAVSKTVGTAKAAATYTPGTSNQTIASGYYLTGTQTIKGDANLVASNIKDGVSIFGVTGSYSEKAYIYELGSGDVTFSSSIIKIYTGFKVNDIVGFAVAFQNISSHGKSNGDPLYENAYDDGYSLSLSWHNLSNSVKGIFSYAGTDGTDNSLYSFSTTYSLNLDLGMIIIDESYSNIFTSSDIMYGFILYK